MPIDLTRSLLVILIPGAIAIAPWFFWATQFFTLEPVKGVETAQILQALFFVCAVVVGTIIEGTGTHFEMFFDRSEKLKKLDVDKNWYKYLSLTPSSEPVGFRFLSKLATTFYFELAMMVATPLCLFGLAVFLHSYIVENDWFLIILLLLTSVASFFYFYKQAKSTHEALCETRFELNKLIKVT